MINYDELWSEIDKIIEEEFSKKKPHERTISEFSKLWGMSEEKAKLIVTRLEQLGQLLSRMAISPNGRKVKVYYPVEHKTK